MHTGTAATARHEVEIADRFTDGAGGSTSSAPGKLLIPDLSRLPRLDQLFDRGLREPDLSNAC